MANQRINIFVNMGMAGKKTSTFQVEKSMKVSAFLQAVVDKEGVEGVRIACMGKQLEAVRNGKETTLADYGVYNNINMSAALRLKGGAEGPVYRQFDMKEVETLTKDYGHSIVTEGCHIGISDGCYEDNVRKVKFECGCVFCADCMKYQVNQQVVVNSSTDIYCATSAHGKTLDIALVYAVAALSCDERNAFNKKLDETQYTKPNAIIRICPQNKCQSFVFRDDTNSQRIKCGVCHQFMCWECHKPYKTNLEGHCGNEGCDDVAKANHIILMQSAKTKVIAGKQVTDTRMCPVCECVNVHERACQHMTCKKCQHQYCHICLKNWTGHQSAQCVVAPIQNIN